MKNKTLESIDVTSNDKYVFNFKSKNDKGEDTVVQIFADGVFPCLGSVPVTDFLKDSDVFLDAKGYIIHGNESIVPTRMQKYYTGTSEWGVFVAGDTMAGVYHQFAIAGGNGVTCALDVLDYLKGL
jgi:thioredoxin reductase